jgi:hypothetical protein
VLLGRRPRHPEFDRYFPWSDVVFEVEPHAGIGETLSALERQPTRLASAGRANMAECLRRHDWAYRWEYVLRLAGIEPLASLRDRREALAARSATLLGQPRPSPAVS